MSTDGPPASAPGVACDMKSANAKLRPVAPTLPHGPVDAASEGLGGGYRNQLPEVAVPQAAVPPVDPSAKPPVERLGPEDIATAGVIASVVQARAEPCTTAGEATGSDAGACEAAQLKQSRWLLPAPQSRPTAHLPDRSPAGGTQRDAHDALRAPERQAQPPARTEAGRPPPKPASSVMFSRRNAPYVCQVSCPVL